MHDFILKTNVFAYAIKVHLYINIRAETTFEYEKDGPRFYVIYGKRDYEWSGKRREMETPLINGLIEDG